MPKARTNSKLSLDGRTLNLGDVDRVARAGIPPRITLNRQAQSRIRAGHAFVRRVIGDHRTVYGINTGFGRLADVSIPLGDLRQLQRNLILSHSAGVGPLCLREEVRAMMLLRLNLLARGHSGVRLEVARRLADFLNLGICPLVPRWGSVGASGDLAPMAHIALALIGEGQVEIGGRLTGASRVLSRLKLAPIVLEPKEGLALVNGVQASTALLALAINDLRRLMAAADAVCALTSLAVGARPEAFDLRLARVRPHPGHLHSAQRVMALLQGQPGVGDTKRVQDPYSIRCAPQVHGVCHEAIEASAETCTIEMNSSTDNPLLFPQQGDALSGGNFHGAPIGHAADRCAIAICDAAAISERRTALLMDPQFNQATPFLTPSRAEGLHSGMMMWQVTAASLVSAMKTLAHPASVDSIPTSLGQEDHVSMSFWAADKLRQSVERWRYVLAIEALAAWRTLALRGRIPKKGPLAQLSKVIGTAHGRSFADAVLGTAVEKLARELALAEGVLPRRGGA